MEVKSNGKVVGTFVGFADNVDFVLVGTNNGIKKFKASECCIICDKERRHASAYSKAKALYNVGVSDLQKTSLML